MYHRLLWGMLSLTLSTPVLADHPDPSQLRIESVTPRGNGCPAGTVAANLSDDAQAFTLMFDDYVADLSESGRRPFARKSCQVDIHMHVSQGWTFGFFKLDIRGFADLDRNVRAFQQASYKFGHNGRAVNLGRVQMKGPLSDDYERNLSIPMQTVQWSPCSRGQVSHFVFDTNIIVMGQMRRGRTSSQGMVTVDSLDGEYAQKYGITWKRCRVTGGHDDGHDDDHGGGNGGGDHGGGNGGGHGGGDHGGGHDDDHDDDHGAFGRWIQADARSDCRRTCRKAGLSPSQDRSGAQCVSGEARPASAIGKVQFIKGCWGGCNSQGNIATKPLGIFCYSPGQRKDADRTDRIVGCFCK